MEGEDDSRERRPKSATIPEIIEDVYKMVPHFLIIDQKRIRMKVSRQLLDRFQKNETDFVDPFITTGEPWLYHYGPELGSQLKEWTEAGSSASKHPRTVPSTKKVMTSVSWDAKGFFFGGLPPNYNKLKLFGSVE